jgi:hypothetical protein
MRGADTGENPGPVATPPSISDTKPGKKVVALVSITKTSEVVPGLNTPGEKLKPTTSPDEPRVIFTGGAVPPVNPPALVAVPTSVVKPAKLVSVARPIASPLDGLFVV